MKVVVAGALGKMGCQVCEAVVADPDCQLAAVADTALTQKDIDGLRAKYGDIVCGASLGEAIAKASPDILVDFTHPDSVLENIETALSKNVHCVVGTTGLNETALHKIKKALETSSAKVFIAPNFAIGAVLMMHLSGIAAKHMNAYEIIELHYDGKADAPSGTAIATAQKIADSANNDRHNFSKEHIGGARGADIGKVRIHSIRLPGLVANQEVIFGTEGQTLTIKHDTTSRTCFMPGVLLAVKKVSSLENNLTIGLENLLDL